jgi:hypothetical protein
MVVLLKTCFGISSKHSPSHTNEECTVAADYNMATKIVLQTSGLQAITNKSFSLGTEIEFRMMTPCSLVGGCQRSGTHIRPLNSGHFYADNGERSLLRNVGKHTPHYNASEPQSHAAVKNVKYHTTILKSGNVNVEAGHNSVIIMNGLTGWKTAEQADTFVSSTASRPAFMPTQPTIQRLRGDP